MKKVKILTITLLIVLISLVAFGGVYVQKQNRMENQVKDYNLSMNLKGARILTLKVSDDTKKIVKDSEGKIIEDATDEEIEENGYTTEEIPYNKSEDLSKENYLKTKEIIEKRLKDLQVKEYLIRLNEEDGTIQLEIPEDDNTDHIVSNIYQTGKFQIVDSENDENVLMGNSNIKTASTLYNSTTSGTAVYLGIEFNKEGRKKLENITTEYKTIEETEDESTEDESSEDSDETSTEEENAEETEKETQKKITLKIDDSEMITTSFEDPIKNGSIQLSMGNPTTDSKTLSENVNSTSTIAVILRNGNLPLTYEVEENEYVAVSSQVSNNLETVLKVTICLAVVALIYLVLRYKVSGILVAISYVGLAAIYLLIVRYTNVLISIETIAGILMTLVLNYVFNILILNKSKELKDINLAVNDSYKTFFIRLIPICIITVVCCFMGVKGAIDFGMAAFWGLLLITIYNIIFTKNLLKLR